jgi:hypothetical protein
MKFLSGIWAWYLARKLWQKILIGLFAIGALLSPFSEDSTTQVVAPTQSPSASESPVEIPSETPSPSISESPTESTAPVPDSPVQLRTSALGDLADMRKDVADAKKRIQDGGIARLYGNALELAFNIGQLQSLEPSEDIAEEWNAKLTRLETAVDEFSDGLSSESVSKSRAHLNEILNAISSLEKFVKTVK